METRERCPVYKKGDKQFVENYRPISLLPLVSKVFERCVFNNVKEHVFSQKTSYQHGFIPGRNCITQIIDVFVKIGSQLDSGKQIDVAYLDLSKAFDKVSRKRLIHRLRDFGFRGSILKWFKSYLEDRRQQTTILGATSSPSPVTSGVPQGSILGPVLFLIYGNDLSSSVTNSSVATFADDTKLFKEVASNEDATAMQNDLNNFNSSSGEIGLKLNNSKCKVLRITRKYHQVEYPYNLEDKLLETPNYELDLGVWISNNLTWRKQVTEQAAKANCMLGYIKRSTRTIKNSSVRRTLYLAFVRSKIGYATQVWQTVELIARLERVQRRATKYILDLHFLPTTVTPKD